MATHVASNIPCDCEALVVIDAIEGTALQLLDKGLQEIHHRRDHFASIEEAVEYQTSSKGPLAHASFSAGLSVPDQLRPCEDSGYVWRTDVAATSRFWKEWYTGLSSKFVSVPCRKCMFVASFEALDTELMVAQMQGKYRVFVLHGAHVGHFMHEEAPGETAGMIREFLRQGRPT